VLVAPRVHVFADVPALEAGAAARLVALVRDALAARGRCRLALAGGSTPRGVHAAIVRDHLTTLDWSRVELCFGDERMVPPDDPASNFRMARESLIDHLSHPPAALLRIAGELPPEEAAPRYAEALGDTPIDVLVLGMGGDGHVASWFPDTALPAAEARVMATTSPLAPHARVSLAPRAIAEAGVVVMVVSGGGKARRLAEVAAEITAGEARLPAACVARREGPLEWCVDAAAAAALPEEVRRGPG